MTPDDPRHGTEAGAAAHKRAGEQPCEPCAEGRRRAARRRGKLQRMGKARRQTIGPDLYNHLKTLNKTYSHKQIGEWSGVHYSVITRILREGPKSRADVERKAKLVTFVAGSAVTPIGYTRRIQALHWLGYTAPQIAAESGLTKESIKRAAARPPNVVKVATRQKIADTYDRLCLTVPEGTNQSERSQITRARNLARAKGWRSPFVWDDIDNPKERPTGYGKQKGRGASEYDEAVVIRVLDLEPIKATAAEKDEALRRWKAAGRSARQLALIHGWNDGRYGSKGDAA